jgi:hypothetical protein
MIYFCCGCGHSCKSANCCGKHIRAIRLRVSFTVGINSNLFFYRLFCLFHLLILIVDALCTECNSALRLRISQRSGYFKIRFSIFTGCGISLDLSKKYFFPHHSFINWCHRHFIGFSLCNHPGVFINFMIKKSLLIYSSYALFDWHFLSESPQECRKCVLENRLIQWLCKIIFLFFK